jgi:phosphatidylserine/phosphatidylglycerophosphate/cardiolipin synthase-like enzyme
MGFLRYAAYYSASRFLCRLHRAALGILIAGAGLTLAARGGQLEGALPWTRAAAPAPGLASLSLPSCPQIEACFVPRSDCGALVAREIDEARSSIRAQAYTFTSPRVAYALARARRRGVDVVVLLDQREAGQGNEAAAIAVLQRDRVPLRFDGAHSTAHNKVLVIDQATVITGSLNFSVSAERYSAENVLVIRDVTLARTYLDNFARHWAHSQAAR